MPFIVATYVYARSQGQRTHSARTNGMKFAYSYSYNLLPLNFKSFCQANLVSSRGSLTKRRLVRWEIFCQPNSNTHNTTETFMCQNESVVWQIVKCFFGVPPYLNPINMNKEIEVKKKRTSKYNSN